MGIVDRCVRDASKNKNARVEYLESFNISNIQSAGLVLDKKKSKYDSVVLDSDKNESVHLFAFHTDSSWFELKLQISSLMDESNQSNDWRWAKLQFKYINASSGIEYSYKKEDLIDYREKRIKGEVSNIYRVGSLSLEIVSPFNQSRIYFNGILNKRALSDVSDKHEGEPISAKLTISSHPTCDKFDYMYRFDVNYTCKVINNELADRSRRDDCQFCDKLMKLMLEDRIDQTLMFHGSLEEFEKPLDTIKFTMWGAKVKRFFGIPPMGCERENLYLYSESGVQIHLSRPEQYPNLLCGMIHNSFDYASHLYDVKIIDPSSNAQINLSQLTSLQDLTNSKLHLILTGFQTKEYKIEFDTNDRGESLMPIKINSFDGFAVYQGTDDWNPASEFQEAQQQLWSMDLNYKSNPISNRLAHERLLGGKGASLVELTRLVSNHAFDAPNETDLIDVSVPRGLVLTSLAYKIWVNSEANIKEAIEELDRTRLILNARSVYMNPMSKEHLNLSESQKSLRSKCAEISTKIKAHPLPTKLKSHLFTRLSEIFSQQELTGKNKLFAVRSSAVGEDSLETSAAGQMKTILDAADFEAICQAVVECWTSQYELEAVEYKSQNGLRFQLPMAVVIQELIECKAAGVATTCNALTGDMGSLCLTANLGLGEGVVSGKETDTIRVSLLDLNFFIESKDPLDYFKAHNNFKKCVTKSSDNGDTACCLTDSQILSLSLLLLRLRKSSSIKEREVEWGLTEVSSLRELEEGSSCSSSSSHLDDEKIVKFQIHLLQSRPLTHLTRLSSYEVSHELDSGIGSPMDILSRANLGEVMPGATCPLNVTYYLPVCGKTAREKPFDLEYHTSNPFASSSFGFYAQMATMVLTYTDSLNHFSGKSSKQDRDEDHELLIKTMIGFDESRLTKSLDVDKLERFKQERSNPNSRILRPSLIYLLALDMGCIQAIKFGENVLIKKANLLRKLPTITECIENLKTNPSAAKHSLKDHINILFTRLSSELAPIQLSWKNHLRTTVINMAMNSLCMKVLAQQPAYKDKALDSQEIIHDFSVLMKGTEIKTESGDVSKQLQRMIEALEDDNHTEKARNMSLKKLYEYLRDNKDAKAALLYREFMKKNGHRGYREFDFGSKVWDDDPSYIIKSLAARLKQSDSSQLKQQRLEEEKRKLEEQRFEFQRIMDKIEKGRAFLVNIGLPRARKWVSKRERSKSRLINVCHQYRVAFRHLAGLLCLTGHLPEAGLVYHLTIQELADIVQQATGKMSQDTCNITRILYKARRRRQRARLLENVNFPIPSMNFTDIEKNFEPILDDLRVGAKGSSESTPESSKEEESMQNLVRGMTSCSGCVTGRACVVSSLDDMDSVEPGDILITYSIDISWSVYFFTLVGIVTEVGGIVSHGAVVAREYGIPTLCTAVGACSKFRTGQMVTLDATKGICYLADYDHVQQ